jgi:hypothetical protein
MPYAIKPLGCDPARVKGMSERLIVSHYENNYCGAVKRLNLIEERLAELDYANTAGFLLNGLKREQLIAMNSMILHELFFDGLGDQHEPGAGLRAAGGDRARLRLVRAVARRIHRPGKGARRRLRMGAAVMVSPRRQIGQPVGLRPLPHDRRRDPDRRARYVRALLSHRLRRQGRKLRGCIRRGAALGQSGSALRRDIWLGYEAVRRRAAQ